jgi:glycosyltransferase involved in cell wall biosynthesis
MKEAEKLPVSVIVAVKNEAARIEKCLQALQSFDEIIVVDSNSRDDTARLAGQMGAQVVPFQWDGAYPKKRQWCLDRLVLRNDWIFFVDADEIVTQNLIDKLQVLFQQTPACDGYFIKSRYIVDGRVLRHGLVNTKLVLLKRGRFVFPVIDDLGLEGMEEEGMGEMEGHYQPMPKPGASIGSIDGAYMVHDAYGEGRALWLARHARYALWEQGMNARDAWPKDPVPVRQAMKSMFRRMPFRPLAAFLQCYVWKGGLLDGRAGLRLACDRALYYRMIGRRMRGGRR